MELICGTNESIVKSWDYALEKRGLLESKNHNLTVTDKRIVASSISNTSYERREIYLSDVKTLDFKFQRNGAAKAIFMLILGIITAILIFGIFLIVAAVRILKARSFSLTIITSGGSSEGISVGAFSVLNKKNYDKLKVIVNKTAAMEIINQLGSIILDIKSGVFNN